MTAPFPDEATLIKRGMYATVGSERRKKMRELSTAMVSITEQARVVSRYAESMENAGPLLDAMKVRLDAALEYRAELVQYEAELNELRPAAWPDRKSLEE